MNPAAVLFDLDGTLVDTVPFILACQRHAFHGRRIAPTDAQWMAGMGTPLHVQMAEFADGPEDVQALVARYRQFWNEHHDQMTRCFPGVLETVSALSAAGHPLAIVTAKTEHGALRSLRLTGLLPFMGAVVCADSCKHCKPHPEPVLLALDRLGVRTDGAVMLGDSVHDVAAARAAGVAALAAGWGAIASGELLAAGALRVLEDIRELPAVLAQLAAAAA